MATTMMARLPLALLFLFSTLQFTVAFEFSGLPQLGVAKTDFSLGNLYRSPSVRKAKKALLEAISGTSNGKSASTEQQQDILSLVRYLEKRAPPPAALLTEPSSQPLIAGEWYLQYTSSSALKDTNKDKKDGGADDNIAWNPKFASEGRIMIDTRSFKGNKGGQVYIPGVAVDTANRPVKQCIQVDDARVTNDVELDWGRVVMEGDFRPSDKVANRVLVAFDRADLELNNGPTIKMGWFFRALTLLKGGVRESGWLETTYVDSDLRIGRGNKGSMFVLTRDPSAVQG